MQIVEAEIDGKIIAFDLGDRWVLCEQSGKDYLNRVDAYFARDYSNKTDIVTPEIFVDNKKYSRSDSITIQLFRVIPLTGQAHRYGRSAKKSKIFQAIRNVHIRNTSKAGLIGKKMG